MKKGWEMYPEKILLMISGIAFLLLIIPAWGQGIIFGGITGIILCFLVAMLPLSREQVRTLMSCSGGRVSGLLICSALAVNFYNTWADSSYMGILAGLLHLESKYFVMGLAALGALAATCAAGCVMAYYGAAGKKELSAQKKTLPNQRINSAFAVGILFCVYALGISAILRANFLYRDDFGRLAFGYKQWDYFSRYFSTAMATMVHMSDYLVDIAPLPQLLAMLIMAVSAVLTMCIVYDRNRFSVWEVAAMVPFVLNPYFLECVSYRFDAPNMAVSVLFGVLPLLYRNRSHWAYLFASMVGILAVCTSYQAATGVFPILVILLAMRMLHRGEKLKNAALFCLKSAAGYGMGLVFFKLVIMRPAEAGYVSNALPGAAELIPNTVQNLKQYYGLILTDFKFFWLLLAAAMVLGFLWVSVIGSERKRSVAALISGVSLLMMSMLCFGIYPVLANTIYEPRAMYGFGILLSLLAMVAAEGKDCTAKLPAAVLAWTFFVFSFQYGNVLNMQKEYTDFRINLVLQDIQEMELFQSGDPVKVQLNGSIGRSPIIDNMPDEPGVLYRLLPDTFGSGNDWTQYGFYYYYDLPDNVVWDRETDLRDMQLPVYKQTLYHTIYAEEGHVLIELK